MFLTEGQFCFCFGSEHLTGPRDVAIGTNDQLFVSNFYNQRIYVFTLEGNIVNEFGKEGSGEGNLTLPFALLLLGMKNYL